MTLIQKSPWTSPQRDSVSWDQGKDQNVPLRFLVKAEWERDQAVISHHTRELFCTHCIWKHQLTETRRLNWIVRKMLYLHHHTVQLCFLPKSNSISDEIKAPAWLCSWSVCSASVFTSNVHKPPNVDVLHSEERRMRWPFLSAPARLPRAPACFTKQRLYPALST